MKSCHHHVATATVRREQKTQERKQTDDGRQAEQEEQKEEQLQRPLASDLAKGYERYHRCFHNNHNHNTSKYSTPGEVCRRWRGEETSRASITIIGAKLDEQHVATAT